MLPCDKSQSHCKTLFCYTHSLSLYLFPVYLKLNVQAGFKTGQLNIPSYSCSIRSLPATRCAGNSMVFFSVTIAVKETMPHTFHCFFNSRYSRSTMGFYKANKIGVHLTLNLIFWLQILLVLPIGYYWLAIILAHSQSW